ncbi:DNA repair protein RecN [Paenibacillus contaminans]|uniref:DNA repair protein RecN n=1 Tax=Paenibacillus contaminans TaxID=450362 RepID=A0A329MIP3_9BACL|nr:DNA repair protein RecN [Paenibacillus contaminans]RAV18643.1 DNA repair protein RecN [Paenibacillus contaminans]
MLTALSIRNLAVIESVQLTFRQGFHVLTGETGAGKSIIIDALSLIAGGRGSSELVRYGCDKAEIEALFSIAADHPVWEVLDKLGVEASPDEDMIVRREITVQGKSSSRINGQLVNLAMLREVGQRLVNIHGQHEHQSLLQADEHIVWLDLFGGREIADAKERYEASYERHAGIVRQLRDLQETSKQALQMLDLYRFQAEEISAAKLKIGEDESLLEEKRKLSNAEKLYQNASDAYEAVYGAGKGLDTIRKAFQRVQDIAALDASLTPLAEQMQSAFYQLEDAAYQLRDYRDDVEFNPGRLDQIEHRLDLISSLRRKYGDNVGEMLAYLDKINNELALIENKDESLHRLEKEAEEERVKLVELALALSNLRKQAASQLTSQIESELRQLHMERTRMGVQIERVPDASGIDIDGTRVRLTRQGCDNVEFLISPNPGEPLRGLGKIASGGELSRIMLAMKAIFARMDRIPVLVFDEVDTGVSGRAAQAIAEKLSVLSMSCQVFSITHLPQVACMSDVHFLIQKSVEGERTYTRVHDLSEERRVEELARMLGGVEVTETTLHHAQEMIKLADGKKAQFV